MKYTIKNDYQEPATINGEDQFDYTTIILLIVIIACVLYMFNKSSVKSYSFFNGKSMMILVVTFLAIYLVMKC